MKLYASHLIELANQIADIQKQHPKATVYFDTEHGEILITYPLPKDFIEITKTTHGIYD